MGLTEDVRNLVEPALTAAGFELWDVEHERDVLRILIDRAGGVDLDAIAAANKVLSPLLDEHPEVTPEPSYQLEVSSPGVERTLRTVSQYQRFAGTEITVKSTDPVDGSRRHRGRLVSADADGIVLALESGGAELTLPYQQIQRARTVLVWGPSQSPRRKGAPGRGAARSAAPVPAKGAGSATHLLDSKDAGS
jgi:ribosome maturation factor RimP